MYIDKSSVNLANLNDPQMLPYYFIPHVFHPIVVTHRYYANILYTDDSNTHFCICKMSSTQKRSFLVVRKTGKHHVSQNSSE